ncbi:MULTISPECIES: hypothetical protein [unclassified Streptomyces]|uniref:hypothetical protein n=1 Tax=unclassified Streptomyces TaxID=2593676 RepID=UPI00225125B6|nr:hypothetical protein [Streptomyces sp. NBC_01551]MCX4529830.1 hypothetical protein [Streptomyces sp. NBC_01551]
MFVEVQRADAKATALSGVTGALLAIVTGTALSSLVGSSHLLAAALAGAGSLLGAALISALRALRPVFPKDDRAVWRENLLGGEGGRTADEPAGRAGSAPALEGETERGVALTALARRKFRAIKLAIDLTVAAIAMAGLGLLLAFLTA